MFFIKKDNTASAIDINDMKAVEFAIASQDTEFIRIDDDGKESQATLEDVINARDLLSQSIDFIGTSDLQAELEQSRAEQEKLRDSITELTAAITALLGETKRNSGEVK